MKKQPRERAQGVRSALRGNTLEAFGPLPLGVTAASFVPGGDRVQENTEAVIIPA